MRLNLKKKVQLPVLAIAALILSAFVLGAAARFAFPPTAQNQQVLSLSDQTNPPSGPYLNFLLETFDTIGQNYWQELKEKELTDLFVRAAEQLIGQPQTLPVDNKKDLAKLLGQILAQIDTPQGQKEFSTKVADLVLNSLEPAGRSRLYTTQDQEDLARNVNNLNAEGQVEPTIQDELVGSQILYLHWKKFSPTSLEELETITKKYDRPNGPNALVLDLRDNVGGTMDGLPYFLGPFIGPDQYAYQFFSRGEKIDVKTKTGWMPSLVRYKKVVILINQGTQSTAELMTAALKKYNVGVVVGVPTRGWGTVERVFPLKSQLDQNEQYSIFLVHSLTLREDGQPIQENGVDPVINITDPDWEKELLAYFDSTELIEAVREIWSL